MEEPSKPSPSAEDRTVKMDEVEVCGHELGFVTGIDEDGPKFFLQMTKFTNKELKDLNKQINEYCVIKSARANPEIINLQIGEVLCARYAADGNWYRTVVKGCNDQTRESQAYFADYGNVIKVRYEDYLRVLPSELPIITHHPFGVYCKYKEDKTLPSTDKILSSLLEEYIMVKTKQRLESNLWLVEIPNIAYNQVFLNSITM